MIIYILDCESPEMAIEEPESVEKALLLKVPSDLHSRWKAFAKSRGLSLKALQVLLMRQILGEQGDVGLQERTEEAGSGKRPSLSIRLYLEEIAAVKKAAAVEGHSISGWLAALVRARLSAAPVHTHQEVAALQQAQLQLMALGRNLNTAVRRLNQEEKWMSQVKLMEAVSQQVRAVEREIQAIKKAGLRRGEF